ncbi:unnamed protein product [Moneuplotes crassus]|uniref:Uncharacterized protein n=1 Tax=Euplotes crassus TaxID=5936 RepID=A0AAD1UIZ1_EUPCR|nr:unnamed protein product [Moneuplotes crassus]
MESLREIELEVHKQEKLFYISYRGVLSRPLGYSMKKLYEGQCGMRSKKEIRNLGCDKLRARFNMIGFARDRSFYPDSHLEYMEHKCFDELEIWHSKRYEVRDSPELYTKNCIPRRGIINICRVARFITTVFNIEIPSLQAKDLNKIFHAFHHVNEFWMFGGNVVGSPSDFRIDPSVEFKITVILPGKMKDNHHWLSALVESPSIRKNLRSFRDHHSKNKKLEEVLAKWKTHIYIERR